MRLDRVGVPANIRDPIVRALMAPAPVGARAEVNLAVFVRDTPVAATHSFNEFDRRLPWLIPTTSLGQGLLFAESDALILPPPNEFQVPPTRARLAAFGPSATLALVTGRPFKKALADHLAFDRKTGGKGASRILGATALLDVFIELGMDA
ncbi:MAG: hypothetical protein A3E78_08420 [Alphaproteobacteria bacterium RIFCSPHIGHO2_12_FULL_63_12]|nr:MAG: hypothetical protein A3E78_08420 [Alphaproteobacteria bacterium RIFCSPHIGHO2_12_FULL_63_12]